MAREQIHRVHLAAAIHLREASRNIVANFSTRDVIQSLEIAGYCAQGIMQVTAAAEYVQARYNPGLNLLGYAVTRFKTARAFQWSYLTKLKQRFGKLAFATIIPDRASYERSVTLGVPITLHAPASREAGTARKLFAEINRRISRAAAAGARSRRQDLRPAGVVAV